MSSQLVRMRVPRPNYAVESDPGKGYKFLGEYVSPETLSMIDSERIERMTDEQFGARQKILPKKRAAAERRIREEMIEKNRRMIEFRTRTH